MHTDPVKRWHEIVERGDLPGLEALLDDDVVFRSPVMHTPQPGKALTAMYLAAAFRVLVNGHFRYVSEARGEHHAVLEFVTELDGVEINGVDMMWWNADGRLVEFKYGAAAESDRSAAPRNVGKARSVGQRPQPELAWCERRTPVGARKDIKRRQGVATPIAATPGGPKTPPPV